MAKSTDIVEQSLQDIADKLKEAWTNNQCLTCPLAELSALAAATLAFYQENKKSNPYSISHWTTKGAGNE